MSDMNIPEGTPQEIADFLQKPEVQSIVQSMIAPLASKKDEILDKYAQTKKAIDELGGFDAIKSKISAHDQAAAEAKRAAEQAALASNDVEAIKKTYADQLKAVQDELNGLKNAQVQNEATRKINKAIAESKGVAELLEPVVKARTKTEVVDGKVVVKVLNASGAPMLNADGKDATMADLMNELKMNAIYSRAFDADVKGGSGAKTGSTGTSVATDNPFMKNTPAWNVTKQMLMIKSQPELAKALAAQAGRPLNIK